MFIDPMVLEILAGPVPSTQMEVTILKVQMLLTSRAMCYPKYDFTL